MACVVLVWKDIPPTRQRHNVVADMRIIVAAVEMGETTIKISTPRTICRPIIDALVCHMSLDIVHQSQTNIQSLKLF